jgi:RNA recognition motif-containing protein
VPSTGRYLDTEQRKVIIKNIAWNVKEDQVTKLIRETSGSDWDKIQDINTQRDKKGNIKYVFVLFKTTGSAQRLESKLNNREFRGRPLAVKLAQEGATAAETTAVPGQKGSGKRNKNRNKEKDKDKSLEKEFKKVVIADGSSTRKSA